ncbi:MAG TPA: alpha/beta fold hydrolase [Bryobacteraceae bacterium]|nr:alpha/beta fold hydrolase [Bryobacteraceae bacterium]
MKHFERELVQGYLHGPPNPNGNGLVITHGAGSNSDTALLRAVAEAFAQAGVTVLRCDLPFRQQRPKGPPFPAQAGRDREGLRRAAEAMRELVPGRVFLGGHSYGGRQASMLAAEETGLADALLLLSYPLHPPRKPQDLRTGHFGSLNTPALFVHGTRDSFGSIDEMRAVLELIPARTDLAVVDGAGHSLHPGVAPLCVERLSVL